MSREYSHLLFLFSDKCFIFFLFFCVYPHWTNLVECRETEAIQAKWEKYQIIPQFVCNFTIVFSSFCIISSSFHLLKMVILFTMREISGKMKISESLFVKMINPDSRLKTVHVAHVLRHNMWIRTSTKLHQLNIFCWYMSLLSTYIFEGMFERKSNLII